MKSSVCIACVDASRARLFALESAPRASGDVSRLVEFQDLVQPGRRARPSEAMSETRPGIRQSSAHGGPGHGTDDHRDGKQDHSDRKFAGAVVKAIARAIDDLGADQLVLAASPRMLGWLREFGSDGLAGTRRTLDKNLAALSASELRDHLVAAELLPASVSQVSE